MRKDLNELRSESDLGNKQNSGFLGLKSLLSEFEVDICLAATSDTVEEFSVTRGVLELL